MIIKIVEKTEERKYIMFDNVTSLTYNEKGIDVTVDFENQFIDDDFGEYDRTCVDFDAIILSDTPKTPEEGTDSAVRRRVRISSIVLDTLNSQNVQVIFNKKIYIMNDAGKTIEVLHGFSYTI